MTDRIRIADLRDLVQISEDDAVSQVDFDLICDALRPLLDVVEAAHDIPIDRRYQKGVRLGRALDRFDFEA